MRRAIILYQQVWRLRDRPCTGQMYLYCGYLLRGETLSLCLENRVFAKFQLI